MVGPPRISVIGSKSCYLTNICLLTSLTGHIEEDVVTHHRGGAHLALVQPGVLGLNHGMSNKYFILMQQYFD